ncbi:ribosome silencing factor [Schleiferia thermophila]|jgi:ribosome-associated protein|uniref:Ribosomal silencing factor RsfS n=1 Tax=Schleiferia thermophila TaxID=884107 RepID=A0A369A4L0_9FLAO|nr:ribosome silencing factor [Schleiferia thermophila]RCX03348.1 ribosome-associated protein [Schleiferia thermophila]GCD80477.1 ribosomal silencing factor RsfS [Schleiferia thermophila]
MQIKHQVDTNSLVFSIIEGLREVKGFNIRIFDLSAIEKAVCDTFIVAEGNSTTQVSALAESVEKKVLENTGEKPWHIEGKTNAQWVLLDYIDVVVHIFLPEARTFYDLDGLWSDARITDISND